MGKYMIRVESMDGNEPEVDEAFADGIECDGFCIMAGSEEKHHVALHQVSIDHLADIIMNNHSLLAAAILAKARKEALEECRKGETGDLLRGLLERIGG